MWWSKKEPKPKNPVHELALRPEFFLLKHPCPDCKYKVVLHTEDGPQLFEGDFLEMVCARALAFLDYERAGVKP